MMFSLEAHHSWYKKEAHGKRQQAKVISFILEKLELYNSFSAVLEDSDDYENHKRIVADATKDCHENHTQDVSITTIRRWWDAYSKWGELPCHVKVRKAQLKKKYKSMSQNAKINDGELLILKQIVDANPNYYLDEVTLLFGVKTGKFVHYTTIWRYMTMKLDYSMQVLSKKAKQQCEEEGYRFRQALALLLQGCPERMITIDETHKDRNASRRRRGWAHKNSGGVNMKEWYQSVIRYTLIAAADINGFIPAACHTVVRDETSDEGAAGTVDSDYFLKWVKDYLCPVLGQYEFGEARSVVFMDNASTHMSEEVEDAINDVGAVLIYGAPYSPHLNPIENYFSIYKAYLKRNEKRMVDTKYS